MRKEACFAISNILACNAEITRVVLNHEILHKMINLLLKDTIKVK